MSKGTMRAQDINRAFSAESIVIIVESNWIQLKTVRRDCLVWLNEINQTNQIGQMNQVNQINRKGLGPSQRSQALAYRKGLAVYV